MTAALLLFAGLGLAFGFLAVLAMLSMLGRVNRAERGEARQAETVMRQAVRIARLERAAIDRELALDHTRQDAPITLSALDHSRAARATQPPRTPNMQTFSIEITDDMIERAIARSVTKTTYDEDGEAIESPINLSSLVKKAVQDRIDREVSTIVQAEVEQSVRSAVVAVLADGFPVFDQWGTKTGIKTLRDLIGARCFPPDRGQDSLVSAVRDEAQKTIRAMVAEAVKSAGKDIDAMFAAAATEGLAKVMAQKLGIR